MGRGGTAHWHQRNQGFDAFHCAMLGCGVITGVAGTIIVVLMVVGFVGEDCTMTPGQRDTCEAGCLCKYPCAIMRFWGEF